MNYRAIVGRFLFGCVWFPAPPRLGETRLRCPPKSTILRNRHPERSSVRPKRISWSSRAARTSASRNLSRSQRKGVGDPGPLRRISTLAWLPLSFLPKRGYASESRDSGIGLFSWKGDSPGKQTSLLIKAACSIDASRQSVLLLPRISIPRK